MRNKDSVFNHVAKRVMTLAWVAVVLIACAIVFAFVGANPKLDKPDLETVLEEAKTYSITDAQTSECWMFYLDDESKVEHFYFEGDVFHSQSTMEFKTEEDYEDYPITINTIYSIVMMENEVTWQEFYGEDDMLTYMVFNGDILTYVIRFEPLSDYLSTAEVFRRLSVVMLICTMLAVVTIYTHVNPFRNKGGR